VVLVATLGWKFSEPEMNDLPDEPDWQRFVMRKTGGRRPGVVTGKQLFEGVVALGHRIHSDAFRVSGSNC